MMRLFESDRVRRLGLMVPVLLSIAMFAVSCSKVPLTGRSRFLLVDEATELQMGVTGYEQVLEESNLSDDKDLVRRVRAIGADIAEVTGRDDFPWEFNVIEADSIANAFCLPGGKVAVYTGITELAGSDDELATVMAHEIAHAIARHGAERMTQMLMVDLGGMALSEALSTKTETTLELASIAYGVGTGLLYVLPYSRTHESEADYMGLMYMARAGYDPRAAVDFWQKMQERGGQAPPEFLSTHPSPDTRIEDLKEWMPEALRYYEKAK
jgi:predicted Zn-dependent protease